jgi:hypothetical protein
MPVGTRAPDRVLMVINGLTITEARLMATQAVRYARAHAPKLTGVSARHIRPIAARGYFGMYWQEEQIWFQNAGVRPFLMRSLEGKTIPMWIDDPNGTERTKNPKAKTRTTVSGKTQVLIFRRAALKAVDPKTKKPVKKMVTRTRGGKPQRAMGVPSYPGAPGRIATRKAQAPYATPTQSIGKIAPRNIGVRWYFPGLTPRNFLQNGLVEACNSFNILPGAIHIGYGFTPTIESNNKIPAYPQQPMADRMRAMMKGGGKSISSN